MNQADIRAALAYLTLELDKQTFSSWHDRDKTELSTDSKTFGSVTLEQSTETIRNPFQRIIHFSLFVEGDKLSQGIVGYTSILYANSKQQLLFREALLEKESIRSVITIKHTGNTGRQIAIILFNKVGEKTELIACDGIDDTSAYIAGELPEGNVIYYVDSISAENMLPEFYSEPLLPITETFSNTVIKKLEEVADVIAGKGARSYDYLPEGIPYLRARDIQEGKIITPDVFLSPELASQFAKQLLQEGDILLTKHFGQRKLALVSESDLPAIASEALFIIRPFGVSENYLYRYLSSKTGNAVFNEQLKRIERGVIVPSIRLSDLKLIEVPVFDEETMLDLEQMDSLSEDEGIETALRVLRNIGNADEKAIEDLVINDLVSAGWDTSQIQKQVAINQTDKRRMIADLIYTLPDGVKVYFEIKKKISRVSPEWIAAMKEILQGSEKCFYILTTGLYYEAHVTGCSESLKSTHTPTIEELIEWERGLK